MLSCPIILYGQNPGFVTIWISTSLLTLCFMLLNILQGAPGREFTVRRAYLHILDFPAPLGAVFTYDSVLTG